MYELEKNDFTAFATAVAIVLVIFAVFGVFVWWPGMLFEN